MVVIRPAGGEYEKTEELGFMSNMDGDKTTILSAEPLNFQGWMGNIGMWPREQRAEFWAWN